MAIEMNPNGSNNINSQSVGQNQQTGTDKANDKPAGAQGEVSKDKVSHPSHVNITKTAGDLKAIEQGLNSLPEVNKARVAEIKAQLANGSYKVDPQKVAEGILTKEFPEEFS